MGLFTFIILLGAAIGIGSLADSTELGIGVFIGGFLATGSDGHSGRKHEKCSLSFTAVALTLVGCAWLCGGDDE